MCEFFNLINVSNFAYESLCDIANAITTFCLDGFPSVRFEMSQIRVIKPRIKFIGFEFVN